jgi:hypothetical protein
MPLAARADPFGPDDRAVHGLWRGRHATRYLV